MDSNGYNYLELARRAYALLDEDTTTINTPNGYFTDIDTCFALELAERELFMRFKRASPVDFIRMKDTSAYPAGAQFVLLGNLLDDGCSQLVNVAYQPNATTFLRLRRRMPSQEHFFPPTGGTRTPTGYMWLAGQDQFFLLPAPTSTYFLRFIYVPEPRRIRCVTETESGAGAAGGFASAESYSVIPAQWQHLLPLRAALYLMAKRKDARQEFLRADYSAALEIALKDAASRDITEDASGLNEQYDNGVDANDYAANDS